MKRIGHIGFNALHEGGCEHWTDVPQLDFDAWCRHD